MMHGQPNIKIRWDGHVERKQTWRMPKQFVKVTVEGIVKRGR